HLLTPSPSYLSSILLSSMHVHLILSSHCCRPRDLHSFPTRRSSDLHIISSFGFEYKTKWTNGYRRNLFCDSTRPFFVPRKFHKEDRKSTRLNSSHVSSSYAVFCLKKKKATDRAPNSALAMLEPPAGM